MIHADKDKMESGFFLDVVIRKSVFIFELHPRRWCCQSGSSRSMWTEDKMESGLFLDVVIRKSVSIFELICETGVDWGMPGMLPI